MLYGAECWAVTQHAEEILATTQRRMERLMVGATLLDRKSNEWLRGVTKVKDVVEEARKRKARWAWNIARMDNDRWAKIITEWCPRYKKRPLGRPRTRWRDSITKKLKTQRWLAKARRESKQYWIDTLGAPYVTYRKANK
uniref:Endonuclease-reverse transcriptase n=1 Tax=Plectus sambesii TaxID=2011161 RepID=A0A914WA26_9BILA